jgi:hypothetical protein
MKFGVVFSLALVAANSPTYAQNAQVIQLITELDSRSPKPDDGAILDAVTITAKARASAQKLCQPTSITIVETTPITGARSILEGVLNNSLRNGWSVYARHNGCPKNDVFRYAVLQKPDSSLLAVTTNEGKSYANLSIMRDTSGQAAAAAYMTIKKMDASCAPNDVQFGRTRIDSEDKDLGPDIYGVRYVGSWKEVWQFTICGRTAEVPIICRADGDGGAYTDIKSADIVVLPKS